MLDEKSRKELDDIQVTTHRLEVAIATLQETKQNKVKPYALAAIIIWMLGVTAGGSWWASAISTKLDTFSYTLEKASKNRYTSDDAQRDMRTQAQIDANQDRQIGDLKAQTRRILDKLDK